MKKKNLDLKGTSNFFAKPLNSNALSHKSQPKGKDDKQVKARRDSNLLTRIQRQVSAIQDKKNAVQSPISQHMTPIQSDYLKKNYIGGKFLKKSHTSHRNTNLIHFTNEKENYQIVSCNAGFKNMKKYSRKYNTSAHQNFTSQPKKFSLSVEGSKYAIPTRYETISSCGISQHKQGGDKIQSFERKDRISYNQSHYSLQSPVLTTAPDIRQINFIINSIQIGKISLGRESYSNVREGKEDRTSYPNTIHRMSEKSPTLTKKFEKHQRIRPSTSQPSLRNKFFLTSK